MVLGHWMLWKHIWYASFIPTLFSCRTTTTYNNICSLPEYKRSKMTVLYLNSLLSAIGVSIVIMLVPGEVERVTNFPLWTETSFVTYIIFASLMGSVLNLAIFLCTSTNSALTTTVVGCLKNVLTSYLGMFIGGDYVFSWLNFLGINISIAGSLIYARATFRSWWLMRKLKEAREDVTKRV